MVVGISGYGVYIPRLRIKKEDYAKAWGSFSAAGVSEKSVMGFDEDVLTASAKVSRRALESVPLTDAPLASMWDSIEHALGAGAAAYVLSSENLIAELEGHSSYASEYFGERFKSRSETLVHDLNVKKFSESSLLKNATSAGLSVMKKLGRNPEDYQHVVIQQPDARVPATIGARMKFTDVQLATGLTSKILGDLGAASTPVSLAATLDAAKIGDRILVISYGSGAGSDALSFKIVGDRKSTVKFQAEADRKEYIDYVKYLKLKGALV
jgi:hydroxymethylglutaryl-CoA synthase